MSTIFGTILRGVNRSDSKLNILSVNACEKFQSELCRLGHNLYLPKFNGIKAWNTSIRDIPENCKEIDQQELDKTNFDVIICQDRTKFYNTLAEFSLRFSCPFVCVDYSLPIPELDQFQIQALADQIYDKIICCSEFVAQRWGLDPKDVSVISKYVNTNYFNEWIGGDCRVLTNVDFYHNRANITGFSIFEKLCKQFKTNPIGNSPGLSLQPKNQSELLNVYRKASVFVNTSTWISSSYEMLEAMACGCPIVTTKTTDMLDIIKNGENGFITNDFKEMTDYIDGLMKDHNLAKSIGQKGRETIIEMNRNNSEKLNSLLNEVIDKVPNLIRK